MTMNVPSGFQDSRSGAFRTAGGMDLPDLWRVLHLNARVAERAATVASGFDEVGPAESLRHAWHVHRTDLGSVPIGRWQGLCSAAGWTWLAAAATSWCLDAHPAQTWAAWCSCMAPLEPVPAFFYAAQLMNPAFIEQDLIITDRSTLGAEPDMTMLCVMLAIAPSKLVVHDPHLAEKLKTSPFLRGRWTETANSR